LDRIRSRQPEAWRQFVDLYGPVVYRWCRQLGVGYADAADVVQETFAAVATGITRFRRESPGDSFGGWLRTITRSKVFDHFRRRQGRPTAEGGTTAYLQMLNVPESADSVSQNEKSAGVGSASPCKSHEECGTNERLELDARFARRVLDLVRAEFEPRTWDAFWRITVEGQTPAEVAAALEMSLPAVYKAKSRVLQRLRQNLKDLQGE
jgi:RNA polymerase sigma-70 factor (ECF subfamily)